MDVINLRFVTNYHTASRVYLFVYILVVLFDYHVCITLIEEHAQIGWVVIFLINIKCTC